MRRWAWVAIIVASLITVAAAQGAVRKVSLTTPVQAGNLASLTVKVSPRARCTIQVNYKPKVTRLSPKSGGRITWRWRVGTSAKPGRWPVVVNCGKSGTLRTKLVVLAAEPEMSLEAASIAMCARAPARVMAKYKTELVTLSERTLVALRRKYGEFNCGYGSPYYGEGPISYYVLSITRGTARCTFAITARVIWVNGRPYAGYTGPVDETYTETCKSLRR